MLFLSLRLIGIGLSLHLVTLCFVETRLRTSKPLARRATYL